MVPEQEMDSLLLAVSEGFNLSTAMVIRYFSLKWPTLSRKFAVPPPEAPCYKSTYGNASPNPWVNAISGAEPTTCNAIALSSKAIWMRSRWLRGSINRVLLFWDCFAVTKPLSQIQRSTFLFLQEASHTHPPVDSG